MRPQGVQLFVASHEHGFGRSSGGEETGEEANRGRAKGVEGGGRWRGQGGSGEGWRCGGRDAEQKCISANCRTVGQACSSSNSLPPHLLVVVEDDDHVGVEIASVVHGLVRHTSGHGTIANNGNDAVLAAHEVPTHSHAWRDELEIHEALVTTLADGNPPKLSRRTDRGIKLHPTVDGAGRLLAHERLMEDSNALPSLTLSMKRHTSHPLTEPSGDTGGAVAGAEGVVLAFCPLCEAGEAVSLAESVHAAATPSQNLVDVCLDDMIQRQRGVTHKGTIFSACKLRVRMRKSTSLAPLTMQALNSGAWPPTRDTPGDRRPR